MSEINTSVAVADLPLTRSDVLDARLRLAGRVRRTPVVRSDDLDRRAGARFWLKAENLQRGGSFKLRGALLAVERMVAAGSVGVVAQSTGNHAIAVALAARELGVTATLVLPEDAAPTKIGRIRDSGAEVILAGTVLADRIAVVESVRELRGYDVVDPYQDPDVVAGQGTATAELLEQVRSEGQRLDAVVLPVGGGSAVAGACLAAAGEHVAVVAAEPAAVPALTEALRHGQPCNVAVRPTLADGLRPDRIGALPFDTCRSSLSEVLTVEEAEIAESMYVTLTHTRLLVEPAAATALAAAMRLATAPRWQGRNIGVLLSGGNVEESLVASLLAEYTAQ
ncbi:pyridoxal-phosphate dependent enzyme [Kitasatospora sp. NPDC004669]|uniref:threonine ammonia-lyase n=1 Tax=Kitasatospora sp. NPDC004669 TaxID=3154555 RepID=UPI0033A4E5E4